MDNFGAIFNWFFGGVVYFGMVLWNFYMKIDAFYMFAVVIIENRCSDNARYDKSKPLIFRRFLNFKRLFKTRPLIFNRLSVSYLIKFNFKLTVVYFYSKENFE